MAKDLVDARSAQRAHLVLHDYGMGGLWWWIRASSTEEITAAFAEVEVISVPETTARARTWDLEELDIENAKRGALASFHEKRQDQRQDPAFGRLFGKDRVYLRLPDPEGQGSEWLTEHGRDGRHERLVLELRIVELRERHEVRRAERAVRDEHVVGLEPERLGEERHHVGRHAGVDAEAHARPEAAAA